MWVGPIFYQINKDALTDEISKSIGKKVAVRWRIILTGVHANWIEGKSQKNHKEAHSIHFECDA